MTPDYQQKLNLSNQPGTYIFIFNFPQSRKIKVGKLGFNKFPSGYYLYVGSAGGPGGLNARLNRHLTSQSKKFWHINYLKIYSQPYGLIWQPGKKIWECRWSKYFTGNDKYSIPYPGFGASDCKCRSHLFYIKKKIDIDKSLDEFLNHCSKCSFVRL